MMKTHNNDFNNFGINKEKTKKLYPKKNIITILKLFKFRGCSRISLMNDKIIFFIIILVVIFFYYKI